jgi:outer membrane lipoprotein-sorting protein
MSALLKFLFPRTFLVAVVTLATAISAAAAEPAIIAKARAYVGTEAALEAVKTIHYQGTLVVADEADGSKQPPASMDLLFQKPYRQRVKATSTQRIEVTALDGYDGWQRLQDPVDATKWRQSLLGTDQIKRLRANTWENLSFFRGIETIGGRIEDMGPVTFEGIACQKLAYIHAPTIIFYRYFDVATGRLVYSETENGSGIREQGEVRVNGIRFPKSMTNTTKLPDGKVRTYTITFDKITVNEDIPASQFAVPPLSAK